ncbi:MAG: ABC transporter ATP-binding protein [Phycisphaerales bacterium]|nr:MAG: ABC transporter ATP-binding protein [Phycisphaerales bacterium]
MSRKASIRKSAPTLRQIIVRFWPQIRRQRFLIAGSLAATTAEIVFRLLEPWPLKFVFDRVIPTAPSGGGSGVAIVDRLDAMTLLLLSAVALVLISCLRSYSSYLGTVGFALAGNRVLTAARGELFSHLQRLSLSFHHKAKTGDLLTRVIGDVGRLQEVAVTAALPLAVNVLSLIGMLVLMTWMNWRLSVVALLILPLFLIASKSLGGRIRQAAKRQREREGQMGSTAAEAISAIKVVQALSLEDVHDSAFAQQNIGSLKEGVQAKRLSARLERTVDVLIAIGTALVLWYGARLVMIGDLTPGDLIVFLTYLKNAFKPMRDLAKYTGRIAKAAASGERILDVLDTTPKILDSSGAVEAPTSVEMVRFEQVTFAYESNRPVLQTFDLEIATGRVVALVGPSGAGKSTILSLLLRLYDPADGRITLNGRDIRDYTVQSLRNRVAIVPQENILFGVTIHENIAYGLSGASDEQVKAAARIARAHEFIADMPDGYDTIIGERGDTLSGGQRQRIAIARAAIRAAPILVLDEPTASLDKRNASLVREALRDMRPGRISFIIAHDLSTVEEADEIVYLEDGRILERGTHNRLMEQSGKYAETYRMQLRRRTKEPVLREGHAFTR